MSEESTPPIPELYKLPDDLDVRMRWRMRWGVIGVLAWMFLFCSGVLIPSKDFREKLGYNKASVEQADIKPEVVSGLEKAVSFVIASLTYIPLNVAFLCVLSAFIGGCSINKNAIYRIQKDIHNLQKKSNEPSDPDILRLSNKLDYLTENPCYSAIRGYVVYLVIVSGLFVIGAPLTGVDGDDNVSLAQYIKMAGLFSFFSYLSGYDPTVFTSFISFGSNQLNKGKNS